MTIGADYPQAAADRGRVEPSPRRVRGYLAHELIFDTTAARYVWEVPYYPQYYIPLADVRAEFLRDEDHPAASAVRAVPAALPDRRRADPPVGRAGLRCRRDSPVAGTVRFEWARCDGSRKTSRSTATRATRIRGSMCCGRTGTSASSSTVCCSRIAPVTGLLFETGLPTRYYIDPTDIAFEHLEPSTTQTLCPYKGVTSGVLVGAAGGELHNDLAWTYHYPLPAVAPIAGLVAFYNEKIDIVVDGAALARPHTHFSP